MTDNTDETARSNSPNSESDNTSATGMQTQAAHPVSDGDAAALAYSDAPVEDDLAAGRRPWASVIRWAAIVLFVTAVVAVGIVAIGMASKHSPHPPPSAHAPVTGPAPVLDGTYRLDFDNTKETANGGVPFPQVPATSAVWWAFRSQCNPVGCVATGTELDDNNHQVMYTPRTVATVRFMDGRWQRTPVQIQVQHPVCLGADGKTLVAGEDTQTLTWSLDPQPDGTLRGTATQTGLTNECGNQGAVLWQPLVATRTGDVPTSVAVADPATIVTSPPPVAAAPALGGPVLDGTFRVTGSTPEDTSWYVFRSQCSMTTDCVATGFKLADTNHQQSAGVPLVLHYIDDHWQGTPYLQAPTKCNGTNAAETETFSFSMKPQSDGTLRGTATFTVVSNECGMQGAVQQIPFVANRAGDAPPSIVLPDPTLFMK